MGTLPLPSSFPGFCLRVVASPAVGGNFRGCGGFDRTSQDKIQFPFASASVMTPIKCGQLENRSLDGKSFG